jgi:hypothetical protein
MILAIFSANEAAKMETASDSDSSLLSYRNELVSGSGRRSRSWMWSQLLNRPMPTGLTVANSGRILGNFPNWGDNVDYPEFIPVVEAEILALRIPEQLPARFAVGCDGIAISPDGETLYYCPLTSRHLYAVSVDALSDASRFDAEVAATVKGLGEKGGAGDGLESDMPGRVYLSDHEYDAIRRRA